MRKYSILNAEVITRFVFSFFFTKAVPVTPSICFYIKENMVNHRKMVHPPSTF